MVLSTSYPDTNLLYAKPFKGKQSSESILNNDITVYKDNNTRKQLAEVALAYSELWKDNTKTVDILEDQYLIILLKPDSKIEVAKVYPLGPKDKAFVDKEFNKLHKQGKLE